MDYRLKFFEMLCQNPDLKNMELTEEDIGRLREVWRGSVEDTAIYLIERYDINTLQILAAAYLQNKLELLDKDTNIIKVADNYELYIHNNHYFLRELKLDKNNNIKVINDFIFTVINAENIINPIDKENLKLIKVLTRQGGKITELEKQLNYSEEIYTLVSSSIASTISKSVELHTKLHSVLNENIKYNNVVKTWGWGLVRDSTSILEIPPIDSNKVYYSDNFYAFYTDYQKTTLTDAAKENVCYYLAKLLEMPHFLLTTLAMISSFTIHILKPNPLPPTFIFGASGIGKTTATSLFSLVENKQHSTIHQYLGDTSGFRIGLSCWDEKHTWGGDLLQYLLKRASTNLGLVSRRSRDILYVSNMQQIIPTNDKPQFLITSETEVKAIIRRCWFLQVFENDYLDERDAVDYLEVNKLRLIKTFIEELKNYEFGFYEIDDKWLLLDTCYTILLDILKKYDETIDESVFKDLTQRMKKTEKTVFKTLDIVDAIISTILKRMLDVSTKLRADINSEEVILTTFRTYNYTVYKNKVILKVLGWKDIAKEWGLPELKDAEDIVNYLKRTYGLNVEYKKSIRLFNKFVSGVVITLEENVLDTMYQSSNFSELEEKIIQYIETAGRPVNEYELYTLDENEELIEKVIEKLKKEGRISEVKPGMYIV